jgi:methyl-accepting chemotaxis protein
VRDFGGTAVGVVEIAMDNSEYVAAKRRGAWLTAGIAASGLVAALVFGALLSRRISGPVLGVAEAMRGLAAGNHGVKLPPMPIRELAQMTEALEVFRSTAIAQRSAEAHKAEDERAQEARRAALMHMAEVVEQESGTALAEVARRTGDIAASAEAMSGSAARAGAAGAAAASVAAETLGHVQAMAGAAEELSASIREIGTQVAQANEMVAEAVAGSGRTRGAIDSLNAEVTQIDAVAAMIADIAARTNLLALNATIEAARAGEAGRGFAVVAGEVKQLAGQTARSTAEIAHRLAGMRGATSASVAAVETIGRAIGSIREIASGIAASVAEQGAATAEIARSAVQSARAVDDMAAQVAEVSREAEQTGERAASVRDEAAATVAATDALRRTVVRAIRRSSAEVDRRHEARIPVDMPARLRPDGAAEQVVRVVDLSPGGARIECREPVAAAGGVLILPDIAAPLRFEVRERAGDGLRVSFAAEAESGRAVLLDRLRPEAA